MTCTCSECVCEQQRDFDYIEEAHVTLSDKFYGERIAFSNFKNALSRTIHYTKELDRIKKSLFYGKGYEDFNADPDNDLQQIPVTVGYDYEAGQNIIHAILGIATEAGELLEALHATIVDGKSFDIANIDEETGDVFYYMAVLAKACGFDFDSCQRKNIAKLRMRYGEKFSEFDAKNRNLNAERRVLELNFKNKNSSIASEAVAMQMPPNLHQTTDARIWAKEFKAVCERLSESERIDEGFLIGWFANAIETGRGFNNKGEA